MTQTDACPECLRRSWLLGMLGPYIEQLKSGPPAVEDLLALSDEDLARRATPQHASKILAAVAAIEEEGMTEQIKSAGCWAVCHHSDRFPHGLRDLHAAPKALIGRGEPAVLEEHPPSRTVAIVGSRRATSYGREVSRSLACELADAGVLVLSGLPSGSMPAPTAARSTPAGRPSPSSAAAPTPHIPPPTAGSGAGSPSRAP